MQLIGKLIVFGLFAIFGWSAGAVIAIVLGLPLVYLFQGAGYGLYAGLWFTMPLLGVVLAIVWVLQHMKHG